MAPDDPAVSSVAFVEDGRPGIHAHRARGLGIALGAAVVALLVLWWIYTQTTVVPNVIGLREAGARQALAAADLDVGHVSETRSGQQKVGHVADQAPVVGARVLRGSSIDIALARSREVADAVGIGPDGVSFGYDPTSDRTVAQAPGNKDGGGGIARSGPWVPNVQALTEGRARARLVAEGYRVSIKHGSVTTGPGKGKVYYQDPEPDAVAPRGSLVEVWVSTGAPDGGSFSEYTRPYAQPGE